MESSLEDRIAVIIPAFNEEGRIRFTIEGVRKNLDADTVVVNDGSTDSTSDEAKEAGATVLEHPFNLGYGAALQSGIRYALNKGYSYAVQMDADGQHNPLSAKALLAPVMNGEVDITIGTRFAEGDYKAPLIRRMGMVFFSLVTSVITRRRITDSTSGFQALNRRIMEFYASNSYPSDYPDADVIIMLHRKGFRFKEVPVVMHEAQTSKSMHSGIVPLFYIFKMMLSIFVTMLRKEDKI